MKDLFSVTGKTVLVTGGSRGIGEMIAAGFLANGAKVYISSRKADACAAASERLMAAYGGECIPIPADLSKLDAIKAFAEDLRGREEKLDVLINNAGVAWGAPLAEFPEAGWDKVMDLNVKSIFFLTQKMKALLLKRATLEDPSRVINIGSIDGLNVPGFPTFSYSTSKAAVHHLTRHLAAQLVSENITVNAVAPGPYPSAMLGSAVNSDYSEIEKHNPRKRTGSPEDIAGLTIFLCSRAGAYVVGETIASDGGLVKTAGHILG